MTKSNFIEQQELTTIQDMNTEFSKAKMALGDLELQKQNIIMHIENLKREFSAYEKGLIEKYGQDAVINLQTGEVTKKDK